MNRVFIKGTDECYSIGKDSTIIKHKHLLRNRAVALCHVIVKQYDVYDQDNNFVGMMVNLFINGKLRRWYVAILMAESFNLRPPDNFHQYLISHKNNNKRDNRLFNIKYIIKVCNRNFQPECKYDDKGNITFKRCAVCGNWKPIAKFQLQSNRKHYKRTYRNECTQCRVAINWERIKTNPESKAKYKITSEKCASKESTKEYHRIYNARGQKELSNWSIRKLIISNGMNPNSFTPEMMEIVKLNTLIKREIIGCGKKWNK